MNIYLYLVFNEGLYRHIRGAIILCACFILIKAIPEYYLQNYDDVSCVNGVTGITGPSFISQDRRIYLPAFFQHAV